MFQRMREILTLILIVLLPLHALLVTAGTKMLQGPDHPPLLFLALWKEGLLAVILLVGMMELLGMVRTGDFRISATKKMDVIDGWIAALLVLAIVVSSSVRSPLSEVLLGFKYDFLPLIAFLILRRLSWSEEFKNRAMRVLLRVGGIVAAYGIITLFLPDRFFTMLGYSDAHSLYLPSGPLAAFQHIGGGGMRRIQATMSGPNQLGVWLLLPSSVCIVALVRGKAARSWLLVPGFLMIVALLLTFSRAAWIAAVVIVLVALSRGLSRRSFVRVFGAVCATGCMAFLVLSLTMPTILLRAQSNRDHWERPLRAVQIIIAHPLGLGLGTAGPASNRTHDPCVYLEPGDNPSWARANPALCVFVGAAQVQPADRACDCPLLPENWYLQVGIELGVMGMLLWIGLTIAIIHALWCSSRPSLTAYSSQLTAFLVFLALSIAALFLHAWEDSAVASTVWMLTAATLPSRSRRT